MSKQLTPEQINEIEIWFKKNFFTNLVLPAVAALEILENIIQKNTNFLETTVLINVIIYLGIALKNGPIPHAIQKIINEDEVPIQQMDSLKERLSYHFWFKTALAFFVVEENFIDILKGSQSIPDASILLIAATYFILNITNKPVNSIVQQVLDTDNLKS
jgi:hypothetical protein